MFASESSEFVTMSQGRKKRNFTDEIVIVQALKMREGLDHLSGLKVITGVTLLVTEAGRRGRGDGIEVAPWWHCRWGKAMSQAMCGPLACKEPSSPKSLMVEKESLV